MISDLLDYTQGTGGGIPITPRDANMAEIGRRVVDEVEAGTPEGRIAFAADGDTDGRWDPDRVAQVFANLIGNGLNHGDGGVRVSVHGEADRESCLDYIEQNWTDLRPRSLVERMARTGSGRADAPA